MHKQKGFCLISFLVYSLCSLFVLCTAIQWFIFMHKTITRQLAHNQAMIELHVVHDLLVRDIKSARSHNNHWHVLQDKAFIFERMQGDICIGWSLKDDLLIRNEGRYDKDEKKWKDFSQVIVLSMVSHFDCLYTIKNERILQLHFNIEMTDSLLIKGATRSEQGVYICLE